MTLKKIQKGFTLIELLLTVALIGVLLGVIIVSVDPVEQFANARNRQREADTSALVLAVERYIADNDGRLPGGIDETDKAICQSSCLTDGSQVSLTVLQPYLAEGVLPTDPSEEGSTLTGYTIRITDGTNVYVAAPNAESGATIGFGLESVAAGPFEITDLPGLEMWLDVSQGVTLDDAGRVVFWEGLGDNKVEINQPFEDQRPLYVENAVNSQPAIRFDGINDFMSGSEVDLRAIDELTIVMVTSARSDRDPNDWWFGGAYTQLYFEGVEDGNGRLFLNTQQGGVNWYLGTGSSQHPIDSTYTRPSNIGSSYTVTMLIKDGVNEDLYIDGGSSVLTHTSEEFLADSRLSFWLGRGLSNNSYSYFDGDITEMIILTKALDPTQRLELNNYLMTKYGI